MTFIWLIGDIWLICYIVFISKLSCLFPLKCCHSLLYLSNQSCITKSMENGNQIITEMNLFHFLSAVSSRLLSTEAVQLSEWVYRSHYLHQSITRRSLSLLRCTYCNTCNKWMSPPPRAGTILRTLTVRTPHHHTVVCTPRQKSPPLILLWAVARL